MSRIGKMPIPVVKGADVQVADSIVTVKGPLGTLRQDIGERVRLVRDGENLLVEPADESAEANAMSGTMRALVNNMINGVTKGFEKKLEINGVGYKAALNGNVLNLSLGYSHDVLFPVPEGITIQVAGAKQDQILVSGIDKQQVGQVAANLRGLRPPEPYKGKGIRYVNEVIQRKMGKAGKAGK